MKKTYMNPAAHFVAIRKNDVIMTSARLGEDATIQFFNGDDEKVDYGY